MTEPTPPHVLVLLPFVLVSFAANSLITGYVVEDASPRRRAAQRGPARRRRRRTRRDPPGTARTPASRTGSAARKTPAWTTSHPRSFAINSAWLTVVMLAVDLITWTQDLLLHGELAKAEPKTLRYRLLHVRCTAHPRTASVLAEDRAFLAVGPRPGVPVAARPHPSLPWTDDDNFTAWSAVLGEDRGGDAVPPAAAPARLSDFQGLAPAFLDVGDLDIFRDEVIAYAQRLAPARVPIELHVDPGAPHGFERFVPQARVSRTAMAARAAALQAV